MLPNYLEKVIFHLSILPEYIGIVKDDYFKIDDLKIIFKHIKEFFNKYNHLPSKIQIYEYLRFNKINISENYLNNLYDINLEEYDPEWLEETIKAWIEYNALNSSVEKLLTYLKTTSITPENIKIITENAKDILITGTDINYDNDLGIDFFNPTYHIFEKNEFISSGYKLLDTILGGGWMQKSLYVIAGENKIGKSIWLVNFAANLIKNGINTVYITLEMQDKIILKRIGSNLLNIPIDDYIKYDNELIKQKLKNFFNESLILPGKFYIKEFPTSLASTKDIERYIKKLEKNKGIEIKVVIVDYLNIVQNWRLPNSENMYLKIKQIAEDLRGIAVKNNWVVITATQINRAGFGSNSVLSTKYIAESSGIGHTVDWMGGIIQDERMYLNNEYYLQSMLSRNEGYKNARVHYFIDYKFMRITENSSRGLIIE